MSKLVTEVGRFLRKLRIDVNEVLYDMANRMGCSSAFISAIELGKRPVPEEFRQKLIKIYNLSPDQQEEFQHAIDDSAKGVLIDFNGLGDNTKELALVFARRLKTMEEKEAEKMIQFLNDSKKESKDDAKK